MRRAYWITVGLLLIVAGGAGMWWFVLRSQSPTESLKKAGIAAKTHNLQEFRKYVDVEGAVEHAVDDLVDVASTGATPSSTNELSQAIGRGLVGMIEPRLVEDGVEMVEDYVETGEYRLGDVPSENIAWDRYPQAARGIEYTERDGASATVGVRVEPDQADSTYVLEFRLRQIDGYWQVAELANANELMKVPEDAHLTTNEKAYHTVVKSNMRQLRDSLENYRSRNGAYPGDLSAVRFQANSGVKMSYRRTDAGFILGGDHESGPWVFCLQVTGDTSTVTPSAERLDGAEQPEDCLQ